jgi:hypothetical protein
MKKLLALILCVMMFVAVIPTSAFAAPLLNEPDYDSTTSPRWVDLKAAKDAVSHASDALKAMYGGLAADQGVFGTVKAIDGVVVNLAKGLFEGVDDVDLTKFGGTKVSHDAAVNKTKHLVRQYVGDEIMNYMNNHIGAFTKYDADGKVEGIDPVKYMNTFATAASKAMSSEKAVKNIEALVYTMAVAKTYKDTEDKLKDLRDEIADWEDGEVILEEYNFNANALPFAPYAFLDAQDINIDKITGDGFISTWAGISE